MAKREIPAEQKKAYEEVMDSIDYALRTTHTPDFIEVVGSMGGDAITFRIYRDGRVYER